MKFKDSEKTKYPTQNKLKLIKRIKTDWGVDNQRTILKLKLKDKKKKGSVPKNSNQIHQWGNV